MSTPTRYPRSQARVRAISKEEQRQHQRQVVAFGGLITGLALFALAQGLAIFG